MIAIIAGALPLDETRSMRREGFVARQAKTLFPGYFAFVMATGIIATATDYDGIPVVPTVLYWIAVVAYVWLLFLTVWRWIAYRAEFVADFVLLARGPAFFTTVAATSIVAATTIRLYGQVRLPMALWWGGMAAFAILFYAFALVVITKKEKYSAERAVSGLWLVIAISIQSLSIVGSLLSSKAEGDWIYILAVGLFLLGCALYLLMMSLVTIRLLFRVVAPADLTPSYWTLMGASAISTLAGVELDRHSSAWTLSVNALPVLQGFTIFFWIAATGWAPLLTMLGIWRHVIERHPFCYDPQFWSLIFPLGMYSVATHALVEDFKLPFLAPVAPVFGWIALGAWSIASVGFLRRSLRGYDANHIPRLPGA